MIAALTVTLLCIPLVVAVSKATGDRARWGLFWWAGVFSLTWTP